MGFCLIGPLDFSCAVLRHVVLCCPFFIHLMSDTKPPRVLSFNCPPALADGLEQEAANRGVAVEELLGSLVVTPLSDQLAELHLARFDL